MLKKACDDGSLPGCAELAVVMLQGVGSVKKDPAAAVELAKKVCDEGLSMGCTTLGGIYSEGLAGPRDQPAAVALFKKACEHGDGNGCGAYGAALIEGQGVKKDPLEGLRALEMSCEKLGSVQGCMFFAQALMRGDDGQLGQGKGVQIAEGLCAQGIPQPCMLAARGYIEGVGVKRDMKRGAQIIVAACRGKFEPACEIQKRLPPDAVDEAVKAMPAASAAPATSAPAP
jgi:TPR repeat protein